MDELIPSAYMRGIFEKRNFKLTDFNKATLIWNLDTFFWNEKLQALEELSETTEDTLLRRQIRERIDYENKVFDKLKVNEISTWTCYDINDLRRSDDHI